MNDRLRHRGPDAGSVVSRGPIALGHRRLSIIDLSEAANQPMADGSGRLWIVFNGEIYNFRALRRELEAMGSVFRTKSDTEVILEAYRQWGIECLGRLNGMFAFAIWDEASQRLLLARDRMGEKPLFYAGDGDGGLIFASELKALRAHSSVGSALDLRALGQYLTLNYTLGESCLIAGIRKLLPAHYLVCERGNSPRQESYWKLSRCFREKSEFPSERTAADELAALIDDATRMRMAADVPLGAFLSGGIDSATVVSAMARTGDVGKVRTFSIGFREDTYSELQEARFAAGHLGVEHRDRIVDASMVEDLPRIVHYMDEPMADTSFIPMYYLAAFAREQVTVALSGDGGDELLAGYDTYVADKLHNKTRWAPRGLFRAASSVIDRVWPISHAKVSLDYKLRQFLRGQQMGADRAHYFWRTIFSDGDKAAILRADCREEIAREDPFLQFASHAEDVKDCHYLDRCMYVDIKTWLPDDILVKLDRATMAHSLEGRTPFLDHRLVEFCAALPVDWKMKGFRKKNLLKESQRWNLPAAILNRKKAGFNAPVSQWLASERGSGLFDASTTRRMGEYFDLRAIEALWDEHRALRRDNGYKLFGLACLGLWLQELGND